MPRKLPNDTATTPPTPAATPEAVSKAEAVRQALAEGVKKPTEGSEFIRSRFGLDVTPKLFSLYKAKEKLKGGRGRKKPGPKLGRKAQGTGTGQKALSSGGPASRVKAATHDVVTHVEAIREAVRNLGAEQVKRLVGLFE